MSIDGTNGPDILNGTAGDDIINGYAGDDELNGLAGSDILNGGDDADDLDGGDDADALIGGAGADTMTGGGGNDIYYVDNAGDQAIEASGGGDVDLVRSSVSFTLGAYVERLILTGTAAIDGTGNDLANVITGNSGNNRLDGGAAADKMVGKAGDDTYVVDRAGDIVIEDAGAGTDTVESSVSYTLANNVENLILTGIAAINGNGNFGANTITGNSAANILNGLAGADTMIGGEGNDTYFVDNAGDQAVEAAGEGTDLVRSNVSFTLGAGVENLTLLGGAAINGTGNGLANVINGNVGANILDGGAGADRMIGKDGNDTYYVDNVGDQAIEDESDGGTDLVLSSVTFTISSRYVDNLTLTGSNAINGTGNILRNTIIGNDSDNILTGGGSDDTLDGGAGDDDLIGGSGLDTLTGGAGADDFIFWLTPFPGDVDTILDFEVGTDLLNLDGNMLPPGPLPESQFHIGAEAATADHRIIYDPATGNLYFDQDGAGINSAPQILFATLATAPATLSTSDFIVI